MAKRKRKRAKRGVWSEDIRARFLARLAETGNARATLREIGHANMFYKRRRRDPALAADWAAAVAAADARLAKAESEFPVGGAGEGEERAVPRPAPLHHPSGGPPSSALRGSDVPRTSCAPRPRPGEDLGGYLRPGRKPAGSRPQPVVRRTSNGRMQLTLARAGHFTEEIEAEFLAHLRATGNFDASARALGFQPASVHERYRKWPAFARACDEALEEADVQLHFRLVAYAHNLLRTPGEGGEVEAPEAEASAAEGAAEGPLHHPASPDGPPPRPGEDRFDPNEAMRILSFIDARKYGRTSRGVRNAPAPRRLDEAVRSVLDKIEAIERHAARMKARAANEAGGSAGGGEPA